MSLVLAGGPTIADVPTLHREDGSKFNGDAAAENLLIDYERRNPEIVFLANGNRAFSEIGDPQPWIDGFRLEVYSPAGYRQIKNNIANESNQGLFILHVPDLEASGADEFLIRFFDAPFTRTYSRRRGFRQVFSAEITEVDIIGYERV